MSSPIRIDLPNYPYHVYCRGNNKQVIFPQEKDYKRFLIKLKDYKHKFSIKFHAYTLLPNHFHLLVEPLKTGISSFMHPLMTSYTKYFTIKYNFIGHVFQGRFQSILIDKENYFLAVSRYIHLNSVEAKLVNKPSDYKWSSYKSFLIDDQSNLVDVRDTLSYYSKDLKKARHEYQYFVESENEIFNPLKNSSRGILAKPKFMAKLTRNTGIRF